MFAIVAQAGEDTIVYNAIGLFEMASYRIAPTGCWVITAPDGVPDHRWCTRTHVNLFILDRSAARLLQMALLVSQRF